jgi:hypothetical protein
MAEVHHTLVDRTVVTETGCVEWTAYRDKDGYGILRVSGKLRRAHRISYERSVGAVPEAMHVLHRCDNPSCINPDHLFLGTNRDNVKDKISKGRDRGIHGTENRHNKLTPEQVIEIRNSTGTQRAVAARYGISGSLVNYIRNGRSWKHLR